MSNESKILAILETIQTEIAELKTEQHKTNRRLDVIEKDQKNIYTSVKTQTLSSKMQETDIFKLREETNNHFNKITADISGINDNIEVIMEDVEEIKEHTEITRVSTNKLIEWADEVEHKVKVPLLKAN